MMSNEITEISKEVKKKIKEFCHKENIKFTDGTKNESIAFPKVTVRYNNNWRKMHHLPMIRRRGKRK